MALGKPHEPEWIAEEFDEDLGSDDGVTIDDESLTVALAPPVRPGANVGGAIAQLTRREHKVKLRSENADRARDIVRMSGLTHAQVNGELNRLSTLGRVSEATLEQLAARLAHADRWLSRL